MEPQARMVCRTSAGGDRRSRSRLLLCALGALLVAACSFRRAPEPPTAREAASAVVSPEEKLADSLKTYTDEVQASPDDSGAHYNLGVAYAGVGRWEDAAASYQEAIRLGANLPRAHNNLCVAYAQLGRTDDAIAACKRAVAIEPTYAEAFYNLALIEARRDHWQEALGPASDAVRLRPDLARPHFLLAVIHNALGDPAAAEKERTALRAIDPDEAAELSTFLSGADAAPDQAPGSSR